MTIRSETSARNRTWLPKKSVASHSRSQNKTNRAKIKQKESFLIKVSFLAQIYSPGGDDDDDEEEAAAWQVKMCKGEQVSERTTVDYIWKHVYDWKRWKIMTQRRTCRFQGKAQQKIFNQTLSPDIFLIEELRENISVLSWRNDC